MTHAHDEDENMLAAPAMSEAPKMLPCPFCDGEAENARPYRNIVICTACLARGPMEKTSRDAIAAWNRRVSSASPVGAVGVTPEMIENAWAAIVGSDIAAICSSARIVKGDLETAIRAALTVGTEGKTKDTSRELRQVIFDALDLSEELRIECTADVVAALTEAGFVAATPSAEPSEQKLIDIANVVEGRLEDRLAKVLGVKQYPSTSSLDFDELLEIVEGRIANRSEPSEQKADARLYDANAPMADGEIQMTAAEDVLAWLLIEKIGVPDDMIYSPKDAQETITKTIDHLREYERAALDPSEHKAVAWRGIGEDNVSEVTDRADIAGQWLSDGIDVEPLYLAPHPSGDRGSVKVKALEWIKDLERTDEFPKWRAETSLDKIYDVTKVWWGKEDTWAYVCADGEEMFYRTPEEAFAAAQSDYEQRILSALTTDGADHD